MIRQGIERDRQQDRASAQDEARRILAANVVVFDVETTGLTERDEIIEFSAVDASGAVVIDSLVKPSIQIPLDSTRIHGISNEDVIDAPPFRMVYNELLNKVLIPGRPLAAYNSDFDWNLVLRCIGYDAKADTSGSDLLSCIKELYAAYNGTWNSYHNSYKWWRLEEAMRKCEVAPDGDLHRALTDAKGALGVLKFIAR